ncbi:MAG: hypothetical protein KF760_13555 [Candidatus Eremiobacteraeota bacterium]|nr:hypothetical protein [Candidatus Eremiobacteraeota bacterium]MCW5867806.1 hypothetical protein [Candidatus Eremiobacteraeota bacterium]
MKKALLVANLLSLFALLVVAGLYVLWPEHLEHMGLRGESGKVVVMQIISFMLLLGSLQSTLQIGWRRFSLFASFIVLGQSILMSILLPGL